MAGGALIPGMSGYRDLSYSAITGDGFTCQPIFHAPQFTLVSI
jgi:hypothetical protein